MFCNILSRIIVYCHHHQGLCTNHVDKEWEGMVIKVWFLKFRAWLNFLGSFLYTGCYATLTIYIILVKKKFIKRRSGNEITVIWMGLAFIYLSKLGEQGLSTFAYMLCKQSITYKKLLPIHWFDIKPNTETSQMYGFANGNFCSTFCWIKFIHIGKIYIECFWFTPFYKLFWSDVFLSICGCRDIKFSIFKLYCKFTEENFLSCTWKFRINIIIWYWKLCKTTKMSKLAMFKKAFFEKNHNFCAFWWSWYFEG